MARGARRGADCGLWGRTGGGERSTATTTPPSETATPPPTTAATTASSGAAGASEGSRDAVDGSFEQGAGACELRPEPVSDGTWPMPHHDPAGTNAAPPANGPTGFPLNERWTMSALEAQVTFPVADADFVYLVAADPDSAPSVPTSAVLCHDPRRNGEIQWRYKVDAMPVGPPVAAAGVVYVPFGSREDARVLAIDRSNGQLRAAYDLPGRFVGELGTAGTSLVMPSEDAYRVVDARTGEFCWSFTPNEVRRTDRRDRKIRAAAAGDDVVVATIGNGIAGFDPATGEALWTAAADASIRPATLAVADGVAVYGTRRTLHGLDVATGTERWSLPFGVRGDVIFVGDVLFAVGRSDPTSQRILLAAVDAKSGEPRWQQEIYDPIVDVMAANGYLYAITSDGRLFAFTSV